MEKIALLVSCLSAAFTTLFGILGFVRTNKKDGAAAGNDKGVFLTEIGYIKSGVDDIKKKQEEHDNFFRVYAEQLGRVDESTKSAHHRIDGLERKFEDYIFKV